MTEDDGLRNEIYRLAAEAEAQAEITADLKSLAVQLWANFDVLGRGSGGNPPGRMEVSRTFL